MYVPNEGFSKLWEYFGYGWIWCHSGFHFCWFPPPLSLNTAIFSQHINLSNAIITIPPRCHLFNSHVRKKTIQKTESIRVYFLDFHFFWEMEGKEIKQFVGFELHRIGGRAPNEWFESQRSEATALNLAEAQPVNSYSELGRPSPLFGPQPAPLNA